MGRAGTSGPIGIIVDVGAVISWSSDGDSRVSTGFAIGLGAVTTEIRLAQIMFSFSCAKHSGGVFELRRRQIPVGVCVTKL